MTNAHHARTEWNGRSIHWFNPENDLALASGLTNYTPPKAARMIHEAGEALPLWYGDAGDIALCAPDRGWLEAVSEDFRLPTVASTSPLPCMRLRPWGWSDYTRRHFETLGCAYPLLPSPARIRKIRELSHRRTASLLAEMLQEALPDVRLAGAAVECRTLDDLRHFLAANPLAYLKSPWSSSGRGVIATASTSRERVEKFAADSIRNQGSVMAERACDKVLDFAMLFECADGRCSQAGTSVFLTDCRGAYSGNLLASEAERAATVAGYIDESILTRVRRELVKIIDRLISPFYDGVLGVDMLACRDGMLNASVELNLRTTMGYVAARLADSYLHPGAKGVMLSGPSAHSGRIRQDYLTDGGLLTGGTLLLSPPASGFAFVARCDG